MQYLPLGLLNNDTQELSTSCSRALDSLTVIQLVKELPAFYRIQSSFTLFKRMLNEFTPDLHILLPSEASQSCFTYIYIYERTITVNAMVAIIWLKKMASSCLRYYPDTGQEEEESGEEGTPTPHLTPKHTHTM